VTGQRFDPYATLEALEGRGVAYVLIGAFARVVQGTEELTRGLDLAPSLHGDNLRRLALALDDLEAARGDGEPIALDAATIRVEPVIELRTRGGEVKIVPDPSGTRGGYDDLRRAATREPLGRGLRPLVASIGDLARMAAALGREQDLTPLRQLRILADLDRSRGLGIER
jgi:hypothetical protein